MQHDQMVGKYFQEGRTSWVPGSFFTMIGPECRLDLFWDNISSEDVWRVSNGKVSFGVWYSEDRAARTGTSFSSTASRAATGPTRSFRP